MKKIKPFAIFVLLLFMATITFGQTRVSPSVKKELEAAEIKMFEAIKNYDQNFWRTGVADDYITINADGVMQTKAGAVADSARRKMLSGAETKLFDKTIRVYGNVGIITGRAQFFFQQMMVAEVYYTELWLKKNGKWLFNGWQGTLTKNSPMPPKSDGSTVAYAPEQLQQELLQREKSLNTGVIAKDTVALKQILADEYHLTGPKGGRNVPRDRWLANLFQMSVDSGSISDVSVFTLGDVAVFRSTQHIYNWVMNGKPVSPTGRVTARVTDLWIKRDGRWQLVTRVSEPLQ